MSDGDLTAEFEAVRDELIGKLSGEEREMAVRLLEHTVNVGMLKASGQDTSMQEQAIRTIRANLTSAAMSSVGSAVESFFQRVTRFAIGALLAT
jgi:hypothetical protein